MHGKGSLVSKMPGDRWQKLANLRSLYAYMWAHPGKKLLFMGQEFAQEAEWSENRSLDWHLLENPEHAGIQSLVRDLNKAYKAEPALWEMDFDGSGFWWTEANAADDNVIAFARRTRDGQRVALFVGNFSPAVRTNYRIGLPSGGRWREAVNTDAELLRRLGRRQHGRLRGRGDRLARPALLGRGHAAAAGGAVARARGRRRGRAGAAAEGRGQAQAEGQGGGEEAAGGQARRPRRRRSRRQARSARREEEVP